MRAILGRIAVAVSGLLAACGGGGGGGGGSGASTVPNTPLAYSGTTSAAVVTPTNAATLTANLLGSGDSPFNGEFFSGVAAVGAPPNGPQIGLPELTRRLNRALHSLTIVKPASAARSAVDVPTDVTTPCSGGGTLRQAGSLDADALIGTLMVTFTNCTEGELTLTGSATLRIDDYDLANDDLADATFTFDRLRVTAGAGIWDISGTEHDQTDPPAKSEITTQDLVVLNTATGNMTKSENLVSVEVFDDFVSRTSFTFAVHGRIYEKAYGYVDVTTASPFFYGSLTQPFPERGEVLLSGSGSSAVRVTGLSAATARLAVDRQGDGVFETNVVLDWTELNAPVAADLGDNDGDGMHNSWETVHSLNPGDASDASLDFDGDTVSNLNEYRHRTDPRDAASKPVFIDLALSAVYPSVPARVGSPVVYTLNVVNSNTGTAAGIVVTATLPTSVDFVSATPSIGSCSGTTQITCNLGALAASATATVTLLASANVPGTSTVTAQVATDSYEPVSANNSASMSVLAGWGTETIQAMMDSAAPGSTVSVPPGIYIGLLNFKGKSLTLASAGGAGNTTLISGFRDPASNGPAVVMGPGGTLRGFTIALSGEGVELTGAANVVSSNVFEGNVWAAGFAVGVSGFSASAVVEGNVFRGNACTDRADSGIVVFSGSGAAAQIVNNIFENNSCRAINMMLPSGTAATVVNNTIVGNRGGIRVDTQLPQGAQAYRNNALAGNGTGLEIANGTAPNDPVWGNNLVFANTSNYAGTADRTGIDGNISADPGFADSAAGDYRLTPGSPAIDAGTPVDAPAIDIAGNPRPRDGDGNGSVVVDMGAFEKQ